MPTKLQKVSRTILKDRSGTDTSQIPAASASAAVYKQGATVTTAGPTTIAAGPGGTTLSVRDSGGLAAGDTVQLGSSGTNTATVQTISSRTSINLAAATGTLVLSIGDYILPTSNRPTLYSESTGSVSTGSSTATADSAGNVSFYTTTPQISIVYSGTGVTTSLEKDIEAGYHEPNPWIDIRDYGNSLATAYAALPSSGGVIYMPGGTYALSSQLTITKNGTVILGEHDGSTVISASNPAYHMIEIQAANCKLQNLQLDAGATSTGSFDVLRVINPGSAPPFNNLFENVYVANARRNCLRIEGAFDQYFRDCDFNYAMDHATYIDLNGSDDATHIYFDNCEWNGNDRSTLKPTSPLDRAAVRIAHGFSIRFNRCRFEANRGGAGALSANGIYATTCPALSVIDCHFEITADSTNSYYPTDRPQAYICLEGAPGWVILGCTFSGGTTAGVKPTYAVRGYNSDNGFWAGGRIDNMNSYLSIFDSDSENLTLVDPIISGTATEHNDATLRNAVRSGGGLKVQRYTDAADVTSRAKAQKGTIVYREDTNKLYGYDGTVWNALW